MPAEHVLAFVAENVPAAGTAPVSSAASRLDQAVQDWPMCADAKNGTLYLAELRSPR